MLTVVRSCINVGCNVVVKDQLTVTVFDYRMLVAATMAATEARKGKD